MTTGKPNGGAAAPSDDGPRPDVRYSSTEEAILTLAAGQHGVVSREQLRVAGISDQRVNRRLRTKLLRPLHRGVFVVGPVLTAAGEAMAAVLACGPNAIVSHWTTAALWELRGRIEETLVDVILSRGNRSRPGVRIHRVRPPTPDEVTRIGRIPVTTPARTLVDLAAVAPARDVERAMIEAFAKRLTTQAEIESVLRRHDSRPGAGRLRGLLGANTPSFTRSRAEDRFRRLVRKAQLPQPEVNARVAGFKVDFLWRSLGFVVEVDGLAFHSSANRFETDRRRDGVLTAAGLRVLRVTWRQLVHEPEALIARLAATLVRCETP